MAWCIALLAGASQRGRESIVALRSSSAGVSSSAYVSGSLGMWHMTTF